MNINQETKKLLTKYEKPLRFANIVKRTLMFTMEKVILAEMVKRKLLR